MLLFRFESDVTGLVLLVSAFTLSWFSTMNNTPETAANATIEISPKDFVFAFIAFHLRETKSPFA
jgi:hypothetical protein